MNKRNIIIVFASFLLLATLSILVYLEISRFVLEGNNQFNEDLVTEDLESLPYINRTDIEKGDIEKKFVTYYDQNLAFQSVNLYCSEPSNIAYFIDMSGNILHTISFKKAGCKLLEPYKDDKFLWLVEDKAIAKLDLGSNVIWINENRFHHDIAVADNGEIYALMNKKDSVPEITSEESILDNYLVILTPDGRIKKQFSFAKLILKNSYLFELVKRQKKKRYDYGEDARDVFHTNTVELINSDIHIGKNKLFKTNDILICIRHLNIIAVIDVEKEEIIWHWGADELDYPHNPTLLDNGNILIFDNGYYSGYSRIIELNPITEKIEWEYISDSPNFFTKTRGSAQKLPNNNVLITESDNGHVFEITRDGEIVWEYWNPDIKYYKKKGKLKRATIYRMLRLTPEMLNRITLKGKILAKLKELGYVN